MLLMTLLMCCLLRQQRIFNELEISHLIPSSSSDEILTVRGLNLTYDQGLSESTVELSSLLLPYQQNQMNDMLSLYTSMKSSKNRRCSIMCKLEELIS